MRYRDTADDTQTLGEISINISMIKPTLQSSYDDLVSWINGSQPGSEQYEKSKSVLEARIMLQSAEHSKRLTNATWVLAFATIGLVMATIGLLIAS